MSDERGGGLRPGMLADPRGRARQLARGDGRVLLGLAGPPGSGKSTIAAQLAGDLGPAAAVVPADGFHLAGQVLRSLGRADRKGAPETFDCDGLLCLLRRLRDRSEEVVYAPEFIRRIEEPIAGAIAVHRRVPLVIVEGNYLLLDRPPWSGMAALLDEIWYVDVDAGLRRARLIRRHRCFGRSEDEARRWALGSDERNAAADRRHPAPGRLRGSAQRRGHLSTFLTTTAGRDGHA